MSGSKVGNIDSIQMMRGVAASGVVIHHSLHAIIDSQCDGNQWCTSAINFGASGVDIFFIISGFIMLYTTSEEFGSTKGAADFLVRRAIRIVPLYWALSGVLVLGALSGVLLKSDPPTTHNILFSYLFFPNINPHGSPPTVHPILDQGWTLSYEWYFYLLFAGWMTFGTKRSLATFGWIGFILVGLVSGFLFPKDSTRSFLENKIVIEFCFGMGLAMMYAKGVRTSKRVSASMVVLGVSALLAASNTGITSEYRWLILGGPCAFVLWGVMNLDLSKGNILSWMLFLGDSSYSIYLAHGFITMTIARIARHFHQLAPILFIVSVSSSIVVGSLIYLTFERPVTKWLREIYFRVKLGPRSLVTN